jgi:hypothetical protein
MINPFKTFWKKEVRKDLGLGPSQFDPYNYTSPTYSKPDLPIFANWSNELYGFDYGNEDYVCSGGQCIPFDSLRNQVMGKIQDAQKKEKMQAR